MYNGDPFIIYSRKSKFTGKGESVENQVEMCKRYIQVQYGDEAMASAVIYEEKSVIVGIKSRRLLRHKALLV